MDQVPAVKVTAPLILDTTGNMVAKEGAIIGRHLPLLLHLHLATDLPALGPALIPAATDSPLVVAVVAIPDMAVADTPALHHATTGHGLAPSAGHLHQTGTLIATKGLIPGPLIVGAGTAGLQAGLHKPLQEPTGAGQCLHHQYILPD